MRVASEQVLERRADAGPRAWQEEPLLCPPLSLECVLDATVRNPAILNGMHKRLEGCRLDVDVVVRVAREVPANQHAVATGGDGLHGGIRDAVILRQRLHLEVVAEDDAIEAEFVAEEVEDNAARQRGRLLLIDRRHEHVRGHDESHTLPDRGFKRHALDAADPVGRMLHNREVQMRIDRRVAVPGEMLAARRDAVALQSVDDGGAKRRNLLRVFAERTIANDRILRIGVNVEHGRIVERDANGAHFGSQRCRETRCQGEVSAAAERGHGRPFRERRPEARNAPALLIDRDPQRLLRCQGLQVPRQFRNLLRRLDVPLEERHAAKLELFARAIATPEEWSCLGGFLSEADRSRAAVPRPIISGPQVSIILCVAIVTSAPTRIDLAGGTIDIWPLYLFHPGAQTINAAISIRAHARLETRDDDKVVIRSEDTGGLVEVDDWRMLRHTKELRLLSLIAHFFEARGVTLITNSESPAGAGIAGSSALNVAVCAAFAAWQGTHYEPEALLQVAMNIEAQTINVPTGLQDYRPALYGGLAALELDVDGIRRIPLSVDPHELERRIVLCYTGEPRNSGTNNWEITKKHIDGDQFIFDCFERIRDTAATMRAALNRGDWDAVGRAIADEWGNRKRLAPGVTTAAIEGLIGRAMAAGATAAKVCGAGGGGCLFCYGPPEKNAAIREALASGGARLLEYTIERNGLARG